MTTQELKKAIADAVTMGDGMRIVDGMTFAQVAMYRDTLRNMRDAFGLTMRDDMYLSLLQGRIDRV